MDSKIQDFQQAILTLNKKEIRDILTRSQGVNSNLQSIDNLVIPALENIGTGWLEGKYALSQVYMSGKIVEEIIDDLFSSDFQKEKKLPRMAIVVLEDFHFLGKRIVSSVLKSSGYQVVDFGQKTVDELVQKVVEDNIEILLISVLMLPSALKVKEVVDKLDKLSPNVKIIVGGAPFRLDPDLWKEVKADAMGMSASDSKSLVDKVIGEMS